MNEFNDSLTLFRREYDKATSSLTKSIRVLDTKVNDDILAFKTDIKIKFD